MRLQAGRGCTIRQGLEHGPHVVSPVVGPVQVKVEVAMDHDSGAVLCCLADLRQEYFQSLQGLGSV
jgi:hypothetical protein